MNTRTLLACVALAWGSLGCRSAEPLLPPEVGERPAAEAPSKTPPVPPTKRDLDLATALRLAAGGHLDVLEARARVREAEGRASSADGYLLPILSVGYVTGRTRGQLQGSFGDLRDVDFRTVNAVGTVRISSNLGEAIYRDLAAHRVVEAATGFELAQLQRTLLDVSLGYLGLVESDATVRIQEQFVLEAQTLARLTEAREAQGLGSALDSERARTQAAAAEQRLLLARNERQRRSKALSASLRLDSTVDLTPVDRDLSPATLVDPTDDLPRWMSRAAERRPEGSAFRSNLEAAREEATATRWSVWGPEVTVAAAYGGVGTSYGTFDDRRSWIAGLGWTFSLGGLGRIDAADARTEQADIALHRFRDRLQASVAAAYQSLSLSRQQLEPAQRELTAAESALRIARANYQGGLLPETDLLLAQQSADRARLNRINAVARFNQAQLTLLAEAGVASLGTLTGSERVQDSK